jgi:hypothetical protein
VNKPKLSRSIAVFASALTIASAAAAVVPVTAMASFNNSCAGYGVWTYTTISIPSGTERLKESKTGIYSAHRWVYSVYSSINGGSWHWIRDDIHSC